MEPLAITPELRAAAPDFARRLGAILAGLVALIARGFLKDPRYVGIILPLCKRLQRGAQRVARAMAELGAEAHKPRKPRPGQRSGTPPVKIPSRTAWLLIELRHEAAYFRLQIEQLLDRPEAAALLAHSPRTARILRPICRMLGLRHASLPVLPRKRKPRPPRPRQPRPAGPRQGVSPLSGRPLHPLCTDRTTPVRLAKAGPSDPFFPPARATPEPAPWLAPEPSSASEPPRLREPPCPRLAGRWPWIPHPNAKKSA